MKVGGGATRGGRRSWYGVQQGVGMEVAGGTTRGGDHSKEVTRSLQLLPSSLSLSLQEDCSSFSS